MEFRCDACQHVGGAAEVRSTEQGIVLICASCDHENSLAVDRQTETKSPEIQASELTSDFDVERARKALERDKPLDRDEEMRRFRDETMRRLVPEAGPGPRCPKCVNLLSDDASHCDRCGLDVSEARTFEDGQAPWERPPPGKESQWEQARLLRDALEEDWTRENLEKFASFVRDEGILEMATRTMKRRLVDEPDDQVARDLLGEIAHEAQSRIMVARAQAEANVERFSSVTKRAKTTILWTTLVVWLIVLLILVLAYAC